MRYVAVYVFATEVTRTGDPVASRDPGRRFSRPLMRLTSATMTKSPAIPKAKIRSRRRPASADALRIVDARGSACAVLGEDARPVTTDPRTPRPPGRTR